MKARTWLDAQHYDPATLPTAGSSPPYHRHQGPIADRLAPRDYGLPQQYALTHFVVVSTFYGYTARTVTATSHPTSSRTCRPPSLRCSTRT
jgi:hypothetical protein